MVIKYIRGFLALAMLAMSFLGTSVYLDSQSFDTPRSYVRKVYNFNNSSGSAVVIGKNLLLTAAHIAQIPNLMLDGKPIKVLKIDTERDVALIEVIGVNCPCAPLGKNPIDGDRVVAIGYPLGAVQFATPGTIQAWDTYRVWTDTLIAPGNSGGGLFAFQGHRWVLVGITVEVAGLAVGPFGMPVTHMTRSAPINTIIYFLHHKEPK